VNILVFYALLPTLGTIIIVTLLILWYCSWKNKNKNKVTPIEGTDGFSQIGIERLPDSKPYSMSKSDSSAMHSAPDATHMDYS
jgi:hypothetical protein